MTESTEPFPGMPRDGHVRVQVMAERNVSVKVEIWVPDTNGFWSWRWFPLDELAKGIELPVIPERLTAKS